MEYKVVRATTKKELEKTVNTLTKELKNLNFKNISLYKYDLLIETVDLLKNNGYDDDYLAFVFYEE